MPVYEYECAHCGSVFELIRRVNAKPPRKCPECGETGGVAKRVSAPSFQFKGSGWYVTDYAGKGRGKEKGKEKDQPKAEGEAKSSSGGGTPETGSEDKKPKRDDKESRASSTDGKA